MTVTYVSDVYFAVNFPIFIPNKCQKIEIIILISNSHLLIFWQLTFSCWLIVEQTIAIHVPHSSLKEMDFRMNLNLRIFLLIICIQQTLQHGYLADPPQRSSIWRENPNAPVNYNDNQLFCGGREVSIFSYK